MKCARTRIAVAGAARKPPILRGHARPGGGRGFGRHGFGRRGDGEPGEERGEGRGRRRMFEGGELRLVVLLLIEAEPRHGYDIIREIETRTGGAYAPSPGVVYPTLALLEDVGQAEARASEGAKKLFAITPAGVAHLNANRAEAEAALARLDALGPQGRGARRRAGLPRHVEPQGGAPDAPCRRTRQGARCSPSPTRSTRRRARSNGFEDAAMTDLATARHTIERVRREPKRRRLTVDERGRADAEDAPHRVRLARARRFRQPRRGRPRQAVRRPTPPRRRASRCATIRRAPSTPSAVR